MQDETQDGQLNPSFYEDFDDTENFYALSNREHLLFGDRSPLNHQKVRLIAKNETQVYWMMILGASVVSESQQQQYFVEQQIPKNMPNFMFESKLRMLKNEQEFFHKIKGCGFDDFVFVSEGIINDDNFDDIWSIYKIEGDSDYY